MRSSSGKELKMSGKFPFKKGDSKFPPVLEEVTAFLGKDTVFQGKMTFEGVFRLEGKFEGEIFESGTLMVGETAVVKGKIGINAIIINGLVEGEVCAKARTEIHAAGKLYGTLVTQTLMVNEGGILDGYCKMEGAPRQEGDLHLLSHKEDPPLPD
jgi:cytoskeletal protein CcmA (bactofilin family)